MTALAFELAKLLSDPVGQVEVWSRTRKRAVPGDEVAVGGIVIDETASIDIETGEVVRRYLCADPYRGDNARLHVAWIDETDIDHDNVIAADPTRVRILAARISMQLATGRAFTNERLRTGPIDTRHAELSAAQHRLIATLLPPPVAASRTPAAGPRPVQPMTDDMRNAYVD